MSQFLSRVFVTFVFGNAVAAAVLASTTFTSGHEAPASLSLLFLLNAGVSSLAFQALREITRRLDKIESQGRPQQG